MPSVFTYSKRILSRYDVQERSADAHTPIFLHHIYLAFIFFSLSWNNHIEQRLFFILAFFLHSGLGAHILFPNLRRNCVKSTQRKNVERYPPNKQDTNNPPTLDRFSILSSPPIYAHCASVGHWCLLVGRF
ncbi:hypothetical protein CLIB1423_07S03312 [[Candida] railenensis]|uniref:Uncharacterized protein n=1 Tax=[Candida] railenensis TaxID=45579 RepID=A0A9P0QNQ4_9ASCO|nr:hypothetical protein CLIB1423_07S03312 [[Candida] railenensis]